MLPLRGKLAAQHAGRRCVVPHPTWLRGGADGELDGDSGTERQDQGDHTPRRYRRNDRDVAGFVDPIPVGW